MVVGPLHEVPDQRLRADDFHRGAGDAVFREQTFELGSELRREFADVGVKREEAGGKAEIVDALDGFFGAIRGSDEQTERHGVGAGCGVFFGGGREGFGERGSGK